jgi:hypothetical protein
MRVAVTPLIKAIYPLKDGIAVVAEAAGAGAKKILLPP